MSYNVAQHYNNLVLLQVTFDVRHLNLRKEMNVERCFYMSTSSSLQKQQSKINLAYMSVSFPAKLPIFTVTPPSKKCDYSWT